MNLIHKSGSRGFVRTRYTIYLSTLLLVLIAGFALYNTSNLILGPTLQASITHQEGNLLLLEGAVERTSHLEINNRPIASAQNGTFTQELFVSNGHTIITLRARDRFGRSLTHTIPIYTPAYASKKEEHNENRYQSN